LFYGIDDEVVELREDGVNNFFVSWVDDYDLAEG
jgi:hypothetical protein